MVDISQAWFPKGKQSRAPPLHANALRLIVTRRVTILCFAQDLVLRTSMHALFTHCEQDAPLRELWMPDA